MIPTGNSLGVAYRPLALVSQKSGSFILNCFFHTHFIRDYD